MAGARDKDTAVPVKAAVSEQAKAAGSAAAKAEGKVQAKTQADYTKTLAKTKSTIDADIANAKKTVELANKKGTPEQKAAAKDFYKTLLELKPILDKLGPDASNIYKGDLGPLGGDSGTGGGGMGGGMGGTTTGGKGAYSLSQIRAYMDANNGDFPPDLNIIASGIDSADLTNLMSDYRSGRPSDDKNKAVTEEMTTQGQLNKLLTNFDAGNPPPWAAASMRGVTAQLAARGLGASSMAGQAIIQATLEAALPIAAFSLPF